MAFGRLYGVVRYFYSSDAAASLDWDRFAVNGVKRVRTCADAVELRTALNGLFEALGPGIEIGTTLPAPAAAGGAGDALVAWRYLGPGVGGTDGPYAAKRTHRLSGPAAIDGFVTLMQTMPAEAVRGKSIRLRGQVRASVHSIPACARTDADFAFDDRDAVQPLAVVLIGHGEETKALGRQIEGAVDAPQMVVPPGLCPLLRHRGGIDQANQPAAAR